MRFFPVAATRPTDTIHPGSISDYAQRQEAQGFTVSIRPMSRRSLFFSPAMMRPEISFGRETQLGRLHRDALPAHEPGENPP